MYQNEILYHHGVKGMKWGHRKKYIPHPRKRSSQIRNSKIKSTKSLSNAKNDEERKKILKKVLIGAGIAVGIGAGAYLAYKYNAVDKLSKLANFNKTQVDDCMSSALKETNDIIIKSGQEIHRMEGFPGIDISKSSKTAYVAYKPDDVEIYKYLLKDWHGTGKRYDTVYTALKDIKAPSKDKARQIFDNLYKTDPKYKKQLEGTLATTFLDLDKSGPQRSVAEKLASSRRFMDTYMKDPFEAASYTFVRRGQDSEKFRKALMDKGYSAIEDYVDKGTLANSPLILLDPKGTVSKIGETIVEDMNSLLKQTKATELWLKVGSK